MRPEAAVRLDSSPQEFESDDELLVQVLRPYKANCKYLKSASVSSTVRQRDGAV